MVLSIGRILCIKRQITQRNNRNESSVFEFIANTSFIFLSDTYHLDGQFDQRSK